MIKSQINIINFLTKKFTSFTYLNITQFLGALNDNIIRLLMAFFLIQQLGEESSYIIMSTTGFIFVLPFLLFSSNTGTLADRFSKRNIIVFTKILELLVMSVGLLAFAFESVLFGYVTLFMMATQSAIFGPSKYGIIPEIVKEEKISTANGLMTSFTFLAIIVGTFLASFITDITDRNFILAALTCTIISLAGVITSFGIEYTPPSGSVKRFDIRFLSDIYATLKISYKVPSLLPAVFGSAFFMFLGAFVQLNIIPYAIQSLNMTDVQGGYLFLLTAVGIGTGAVVSGKISGKTVELGLVPAAALGITLGLFGLDYFSASLGAVIPLVILIGFLGGIYQIPLDTFIQVASPNRYRGQVIAATNVVSFSGVMLASFLIYALTAFFGLKADQGFTVMGVFAGLATIYYGFQFFDYVTRFVGMVISKIHFSTTYSGQKNLTNEPTLYICRHTAWNDTLLMLGSQRLRVRFFIQKEQAYKGFLLRFYKMLRVVMVPEIETYETSSDFLEKIEKTVKRGMSVCLFIDREDLEKEAGRILTSQSFCSVLAENETPIIPVTIEKGTENKPARLLKKIHIPAHVSFGNPIHVK
jgi:acyl-[acyl-carrier-protein]-phospholipid O-acyltransferase / long-chain-fatty-acid--[acyl-carrier-protein] ligase